MPDLADAPLCLPPLPLRNGQALRLPPGTCDSHFHVFAADAPLASPRSYTPRSETLGNWLALAEAFGMSRGIVVQPSVYGFDNSVLLKALAEQPGRLRGIAVIAPDTGSTEFDRLDRLGVRGIRINLRNKAGIGLEAVADLAPQVRERGWHFQFQVGAEAIATVAELAARHATPAVIDHLAFMPLDAPEIPLAALQHALDTPGVHVKISAPYRLRDTPGHEGYRRVVGALASSHPHRLLWGSDWPHTELFETMPADDELVALALDVLPLRVHEQVFVHNPDTLYWTR